MKKTISVISILVLLLCMFAITSNAQTVDSLSSANVVSRTIEYLPDGSKIETVLVEEEHNVSARATEYTKSGTKTRTYTDSNGNVLWWFKLRGQYDVVEGVSSVCTVASYSHSISDSSWSLDSASTSKSGNKAMASATFKKKILFVTTDTYEFDLTLTCDKNGNLS